MLLRTGHGEAPLPEFSKLPRRLARSLCGAGIVLGTLFFAAALTPTLIPRSYLTQGALAGLCFAIGYGCGVAWRALWRYLELPEAPPRFQSRVNVVLAVFSAFVVVASLWQAAAGQNAVRAVMGMEPETAHPFKTSAVALIVFLAALALARLFKLIARLVGTGIRRFVPRRVANVAGILIAVAVFWFAASNLLVPTVFRMLDSSYSQWDALFEPERAQPADPGKTGGAQSLVRWNELGRTGRRFIASGPTAKAIEAVTRRPAREPIRVYVGLRGAATARSRARLALDELRRQGGFERSVLIVITPTGTGWIDPSAIDSVEYLHDGDVASVATQYSYLNSPLSLLAQPQYGDEAARALFTEIYGYWTTLPKEKRPRLYLHGLSLGAMNSQASAEWFETIGDPIAGALWSGPPFKSQLWRSITAGRNAGTPQWRPEFRDNRFARFMNQHGTTVPADAAWGPMRIVYLQYASDAITFFDYRDLYRRPDWMNAPRGPDVSPSLSWYPIVTMLQLALDMIVANKAPMGYGHVYAPEHYVDAWVAVTNVQSWSPDALAALKQHLGAAARGGAAGVVERYEDRGG